MGESRGFRRWLEALAGFGRRAAAVQAGERAVETQRVERER